MQTKNKLRAISLALSVILPVFLVGAVVFATTTLSGTTITLENSATIANSTAGQVDVGGLSSPAGGAYGLYAVNTLAAAADLTGELIGGRFAANSNVADTSTSGSVKGVMSQARARLPSGTAGTGVFELTAFYGSADAKDSPDVGYLRGIEVSLDGLAGSTATLAQGVLISNNSSGTQTTSYGLDINSGTASGHKAFTADIRLQNGALITNGDTNTLTVTEGTVVMTTARTLSASGENHGLEVNFTPTMASASNAVGGNFVVTTAGTSGAWASGVYGKVIRGASAATVTGYLSGGEFEVDDDYTNPSAVFPLVLDANSAVWGGTSAYMMLQDFGAALIPNLLNIQGATSGSGNMFYVHEPTTLAASLRILVGSTTYYIPLYTTQ